jgi:hypothetical protein
MTAPQGRRLATGAADRRRILLVAGLIVLIIVAVVVVWLVRGIGPSHAEVLNEQTKAREIRPLTTSPDPRFDPLPLERERH